MDTLRGEHHKLLQFGKDIGASSYRLIVTKISLLRLTNQARSLAAFRGLFRMLNSFAPEFSGSFR
eukprot:5256919-Prorocentrum_lima.AAC.1